MGTPTKTRTATDFSGLRLLCCFLSAFESCVDKELFEDNLSFWREKDKKSACEVRKSEMTTLKE